ncbi:MAG: STAS domain-containing protein [Burkholderiales bacterium]|nr:STAS domain-containing protein [Burkholderiales bacterium]
MPSPITDSAGPGLTAALPSRVTFDRAPEVLERCAEQLSGGAREIDLSACQDFDSSLLGILLELRRRASTSGTTFRLIAPPANLRKLAELYGVDRLLFETHEPA